jgi:hypothetical protein
VFLAGWDGLDAAERASQWRAAAWLLLRANEEQHKQKVVQF